MGKPLTKPLCIPSPLLKFRGINLSEPTDPDPKRRSGKREKVTITLPAYLIDDVDEVAGETDLTRSDVIEALLVYCFANSDIIDEIFPYEAEGEEEGESEEETEKEEQSEEE